MRLADGDGNQHTKGTCLEGAYFIRLFVSIVSDEFAIELRVAQLRVIFSLPEHLRHSAYPLDWPTLNGLLHSVLHTLILAFSLLLGTPYRSYSTRFSCFQLSSYP